MDMNEAIAKAIQAERAVADITVRQLSQRAGIPLSSLMRVLSAERDIKVNQVAQIATALEVYPHDIVEHAEQILARSQRRAAGGGEVVNLPVRPVSDLHETIADAADDEADWEREDEERERD
jgi:predicted transcriptional regulator